MNKGKYMLKVYIEKGNYEKNIYFHDFYELLQEYIKRCVQPLYDLRNPTIWIHDGDRYVRVHSFMFEELSQDTYEKYLREKILDTDYLLEYEIEKSVLIDISESLNMPEEAAIEMDRLVSDLIINTYSR